MSKHYHVLIGLQGLYLPDVNYYAATLREAQDIATEERRNWNDSEYQRPSRDRDIMRGNIRKDGCYLSENHIIEISKCSETECKAHNDEW